MEPLQNKSSRWRLFLTGLGGFLLPEESSTAFALYRTDVYKEADHAYDAALASAQDSIDTIHVNFSAEMICLLNLIAPDTCTFDEDALP